MKLEVVSQMPPVISIHLSVHNGWAEYQKNTE